jgi:hypothetical protein
MDKLVFIRAEPFAARDLPSRAAVQPSASGLPADLVGDLCLFPDNIDDVTASGLSSPTLQPRSV